MKNEELINVFYEGNSIEITKESSFMDLKQKILFKDKKLVRYFSFEGKKIEDNLRVYNYPNFTIATDQGEFKEFTKGKFRCKKCRKYVKISKMTCKHSSKYRFFYNFKLNEPLTKKIAGGYKEENDVYESDRDNEEVIDEDAIEREVDAQINKIFERHKRNIFQRINDLLFKE